MGLPEHVWIVAFGVSDEFWKTDQQLLGHVKRLLLSLKQFFKKLIIHFKFT